MADLSKEQVKAMGRAVDLHIEEPELTEVTYRINALLEVIGNLNPPELDRTDPLAILLPEERHG